MPYAGHLIPTEATLPSCCTEKADKWQNVSHLSFSLKQKTRFCVPISWLLRLTEYIYSQFSAIFSLVLSQTAIQSQPYEKSFGWKNTFFVRTSQRRGLPKGRTNTWKWYVRVPPQPLSTLFDVFPRSKVACQTDAQTPPHTCAPFTFLRMSCPPTGQKETENTRWLTSSFSTDARESRIFKSPRARGRTKDSRKA